MDIVKFTSAEIAIIVDDEKSKVTKAQIRVKLREYFQIEHIEVKNGANRFYCTLEFNEPIDELEILKLCSRFEEENKLKTELVYMDD